MANPYINKVIYGNTTLIDLTADTIDAAHLASGYTAHSKSGASVTGTAALVYNASNESLAMPDWAVTING